MESNNGLLLLYAEKRSVKLFKLDEINKQSAGYKIVKRHNLESVGPQPYRVREGKGIFSMLFEP